MDIPVRPPISNSVADVRTYPGLPPHGLSEDEIAELFDAVQRMKSKSSNQNFVKHGWQCLYALRTSGSATRGDMCVIDPRDGQKIFSLVASCVDPYVPGPPYCTYGLRVPASCVLYVPVAQGSLARGRHCRTRTSPVCRTHRVPWHHRRLPRP